MFVMMAALAALIVPASAVAGPDIRVVDSKFSRELAPGSQTTLTLTLVNLGSFDCAYKISPQLVVSAPLAVDGADTRLIERLCKPNSTEVQFTIRADSNAVAATYPVSIATTYESEYRSAYTTSNTVYVTIAGSPNLKAEAVGTNPIEVYPGDAFTLTVGVDNLGNFRADGLTLTLSSASADLEVKSASATQTFASLPARASTKAMFQLHPSLKSNAGTYSLTLTARYLDQDGTPKEQTMGLNVEVRPKARFEAAGDGSAYIDSRNNPVTVILRNTGSQVARRVKAKLLPTYPFTTQGSVQYMEELAPGQASTLTFFADVDKEGVPGTYALDVGVQFENPEGDKFTDTIPVSVKTTTASLYTAIVERYWYVWAIIVIGAAVFVMRRMKAKRGDRAETEAHRERKR